MSDMKAAQAKLDAAIEEFIKVSRESDEPMINEQAVLSSYVLTVEGQHWDDEGRSRTSCGTVYYGGDMPMARAIGLTLMTLDHLRGIGSFDE